MCGGFGLTLQEVHGFEASMVIDEDKQVLVSRVLSAHEWPGNVGMNESPCVRRFVVGGVVRMTGR
eukprot:833854-Pleurochrysis_carterae.AAC.1